MGSRRTLLAIAAVATSLAVVTAGCSGGSKSKPAASGGTSAATSEGASPTDTVAAAFLAAWQSGDYTKAGSMTDLPDKAGPRLKQVMESLAPKSIVLKLGSQENAPSSAAGSSSASGSATPGAPSSPATPNPLANAVHYGFAVTDTFDDGLTWSYNSTMSVLPPTGNGPALVHFASAIINPQLSAASNLKAVPPSVPVADRSGAPLSGTDHPSIASIVTKLAVAKPQNGTEPSLQIQFVDNNTGTQIPGSNTVQLGAPNATSGLQLASTIDSKIQTAAENALKPYPNSGMVVIKPSTGEILAIATNNKSNVKMAYTATRAPGSTFKTVTATALMLGGMKLTDGADCTPTAKVGTEVYHNDEGLANGFTGANLLSAYEQSCNTSFVNATIGRNLGLDSLSKTAHDYYGMDQPWDMGVGSATYCTGGSQQVPAADTHSLLAASAFGQGKITMCPLTMASVAATVATGQFHQPILIPGYQAPAKAQPLPATVDANLQTMMRGVITNGTATSLAGIAPTLGAKTGSAEPNSTDKTDSWMIAMDPQHDIAVSALVLNAGFGNSAAGPAIAAMMKAAGLS
ncbi:penicillin-binding protein transpeptidase [Catenulispora acidiphila DSM 44928]|uniref:Penicillin-binding protein transpeptidase n=1 Tax=Catenulispora acidiphila (strain DSM 44928 / JCM 14897 / NBRC 102108 / NRRL B-24433 / ID139908) TaxID=479433 RepID=C7Q7E4_CATAD|nr:penicillin-binding transpeptidase domain-containing protein [Catenulispora acidiphila]ACU70232.1 penicillin-binding protein transpeptidase [Catenulispora acidiphila DSM 44928]